MVRWVSTITGQLLQRAAYCVTSSTPLDHCQSYKLAAETSFPFTIFLLGVAQMMKTYRSLKGRISVRLLLLLFLFKTENTVQLL